MKTWAGVGIAVATLIITLWVDPAKLFGFETIELKVAFAGVLLALAGLAFFLGHRMPEINLPRQITVWMAGLAAIAIFTTNMDIVTGTSSVFKPVVKVKKPYVPRAARVKKPEASAIYVPDTLKINRVEQLITPEQTSLNQFFESDNRVQVPNLFSQKDTPLAKDWKPTEKQRAQFKRFLESQGLKYDPDTAFKRPGDGQNPQKTSPKSAKGDAFTAFN